MSKELKERKKERTKNCVSNLKAQDKPTNYRENNKLQKHKSHYLHLRSDMCHGKKIKVQDPQGPVSIIHFRILGSQGPASSIHFRILGSQGPMSNIHFRILGFQGPTSSIHFRIQGSQGPTSGIHFRILGSQGPTI